MIMCIFFAFLDLSMAGICYAVYGGKRTYSHGMLMGVHLPAAAAGSEEVMTFMNRYEKKTKKFYFWNIIVGILISALNLWYISIFMIVWSIWFVEFIAGTQILLYRTHRKLYDMKIEKGWVGSGGSRIMAADTKAASKAAKHILSPWWHLLFCGLILLPCIDPQVREYLQKSTDGWIYLSSGLLIGITLSILHVIILKVRNKVYSEDSELNLAVNRMQKNIWSWGLVLCGLVNLSAYLFIASFMDPAHWFGIGVYVGYMVLQLLPAFILIGSFFYMRYKKEKMLAEDPEPAYIDDDVYWKNGWYSNPSDKRLLVQDWACSWNYTTNMARPAGKICMIAGLSVGVACLVLMCVMMIRMDFTPLTLSLTDTHLEITSGYFDLKLPYNEIEDVKIIESLPDDDYRKTNGLADSKQWVGKFRGRDTGKCVMMIWRDLHPVLEITTKNDGPLYINSKKNGQIEKWENKILTELS